VSARGLLAGRGALVTGGGRGIGAAIAGALADAGARVIVAARSASEVEGVAAALRAAGAQAWAVSADVTDEASVRALAAKAREHAGAVDLLVNAAGEGGAAPLGRISLADWRSMLDVHATGTFLCTRELLPAMRERGFGRIVNVASTAGLEGGRYIAHYCAAKHAVVGFTRAVALEVAGSGVTINAICPGYVDTPMTARTIASVVARTGRTSAQALAAVLESSGQARLLTTAEVAAAALALCGADAADTNGQAVIVQAEGGA
jgi:NAD(P)-dependent dehydrogenase (short-subunit alcohol dehydrogenase family)